ncbi:RNA polymerase, sigma 28 subunit, FliA/WhiG family [Kineococcus radiotolerans SRS30216 = ATCC BAA-149]|uniref:RNA polymerase, sigma 28 subunit, FliA/WhiG family n=1 Tax=Kineococcus radiotolerans (strain ATCC BAA-149 / DSM 14245 / SRS30216) TaxID=266940 RepID=A6W670_KINRD|nr:sigma-70 family RNA polymerase sigma factor [Kineococcus radiotolerans]ABS02309.1 RNA polymerase, sigma 28 subunit, FliA/WhiG family [Kineococcus radiotolerans SRS30216 = ATCC BAA-149]
MTTTADTTAQRRASVEDLVLEHLPLARSVAAHYRNRGEPYDDLVQVAYLGLVKAAQRFDPDTGHRFAAYAAPTITGEVRRHFRDHGWNVRPPRRLQELRARLLAEDADTPEEVLAQRLDATVAEVRAARQASNAYSAVSLDAAHGPEDVPLCELLADDADDTAAVDDALTLRRITAGLDERERRILHLRFYREATQSEIAAEIGVSQMQVSRLLAALLHRLRDQLDDQMPVRDSGDTLERGRSGLLAAEPAWSRIPSSSSTSTSWAA